MSRKIYWGLATLLILIITATVWIVLHNRAYIKQLENDLAGKQEKKKIVTNRQNREIKKA